MRAEREVAVPDLVGDRADRRHLDALSPLASTAMEADDLFDERLDGDARAQAEADRSIADALDSMHSLDSNEAEQVFHRALELEAEALEQPHVFTAEQLERIAEEINMDVAFVRQALGEIRLTPSERTWLDRLILPDAITAVESVEGLPRADLEALIEDWMIGHEGLIAAARLEDGTQWDVDRRWSARLRASRMSGGNRISRTAGGDVTHRVHSITDDEHVVAMQSEGEGPLVLGKLGLAAAALLLAIGVIGGINGTVVEFLQGLAAYGVLAAGVAGGAILGARRWARGIGRALRRSLTGLTSRLTGSRRRRAAGSDLKPVVTELLRNLTERVRVRTEQNRARAARGPAASSRRSAPPPPARVRRRRPPPPPPRRRPPPPPPRRG